MQNYRNLTINLPIVDKRTLILGFGRYKKDEERKILLLNKEENIIPNSIIYRGQDEVQVKVHSYVIHYDQALLRCGDQYEH